MNIPCPNAIRCNLEQSVSQGFDSPLLNFSSEAPDSEIFVAVNYGWGDNAPPLGVTYKTPGCVSWCESDVSQDQADLCAARQQIQCLTNVIGNTPRGVGGDGSSDPNLSPGGPDPSPPANQQLYGNSLQKCSVACDDGKVFTETVGPGEVIARSRAQADQIAHSVACNRVNARAICFLPLNGFACADQFSENPEYSFTFPASTATPPVTWSAGGLPPGLAMEPDGTLHGHPTQPGNYSFIVTATNAAGNSDIRNCTFEVLGILLSQQDLPNAKVDHSYSYSFQAAGGTFRTFSIIDGAPPAGITMDDNGNLSGTPTTVARSVFTVEVQDEYYNSCSTQVSISVTGPKIVCPGPGVVCSPYNDYVTAVPAGCTFSGAPPSGLTMNAAGHITGTPKTVAPFNVTATDPAGNVNTKLCSFITNPGQPSSVQDVGSWPSVHTGDGSGGGSMSAGGGSVFSNYVWGTTGGACDWGGGLETCTSPLFRNCGPSYPALITVNWTLPDNPCPSDHTHHPSGTIQVTVNGTPTVVNVGNPGTGVPASGNFTVPFTMGANTSGNKISVQCSINGGGVLTANVSVTPLAPP